MKEEIKYISVDGTEFNNKEDCLTYETGQFLFTTKTAGECGVTGLDMGLHPLFTDNTLENLIDDWDALYYVRLENDLSVKWITNLVNYVECCIDNTEFPSAGDYFYNEYANRFEWVPGVRAFCDVVQVHLYDALKMGDKHDN